jgi:hypothetical protein
LPIVRFSVSEKANAFLVGMRLNDEFYFATSRQIYRIFASPSKEEETLTILDRLNAAHSDFNIDSSRCPALSRVAALI